MAKLGGSGAASKAAVAEHREILGRSLPSQVHTIETALSSSRTRRSRNTLRSRLGLLPEMSNCYIGLGLVIPSSSLKRASSEGNRLGKAPPFRGASVTL